MTLGVGAFSEAPLSADPAVGGGATTYNESVSETGSLTDTAIVGLMAALGITSETLATAAEAWASTATMGGAVSESVSGTSSEEGIKPSGSYDEAASETVTVSDAPAALIVAVGVTTETASLSDTPDGLMVANASASESAGLTDAATGLAAMLGDVSEAVASSDDGAAGPSTYNVPVSELVVVWDSTDATGGNGVPNVIHQGQRILTPGALKATR